MEGNVDLKPGVRLDKLSTQMVIAAVIVKECYRAVGVASGPTITSGSDGTHRAKNSLHYEGNALDFRIWNIPAKKRVGLTKAIQTSLGVDFDVVLEVDHLHVEYDPKRPQEPKVADTKEDSDTKVA